MNYILLLLELLVKCSLEIDKELKLYLNLINHLHLMLH
nr:MAG TPA: hypothetical protein [Bacteriophage sp.]